MRDALGDLAAIVYKDVAREPIVQEADDSSARLALIADLSIGGSSVAATNCGVARCSSRIDIDAQYKVLC